MKVIIVLAVLTVVAECTLFDLLTPYHQPNPYPGSFMNSYASSIPRASMNLLSAKTPGSNLPAPKPPQVLLTHLNGGGPVPPAQQTPSMGVSPQHSPASSSSSPSASHMFMNSAQDPHPHHYRNAPAMNPNIMNQGPPPSVPHPHSHSQPIVEVLRQKSAKGSTIPLTRKVKKMAANVATQLGYKPYYEAHGCVDPTTILHGQHGRLAAFALMVGCNNRHAQEVCEMAQVVHSGKGGAQMRMMMELMLPKEMKHQFEQCLTPSTLMKGMASMMSGFMGPQQTHTQRHALVPPRGAALSGEISSQGQPVDCQMVSQMLMMSPSSEGMMSLESMEQIGVMRNKYFKMSCQENLLLGSLPYRMCCPGKVRPPSLQDAMMMRGTGGA